MKFRIPTSLCSGRVTAALFSPTIGSGRSGLAKSHSGRRLRIGGSATKFSCGGGDVVAHSRVHASQGLSPAILPRKNEVAKFQTRMSAAALIKKTPGRDHVHPTPVWEIGIGIDAARHTKQTKKMLN